MRLFHPETVLRVALLGVALLQVRVAAEFHARACRESPRGAEAGFPLDDAWIHLVYARSIAQRGLPEYNPGEPEVGQSSLLWGLLLAPVEAFSSRFQVPIGRAVRIFGLFVWIATALAAAAWVRALPVPGARFGAFAAALAVALDPPSAFTAASGMEPLLLALLLLLALRASVRERIVTAGLFCGAAILARPEGAIALPLLAAAAAARAPRARRVLSLLLPAGLLALPWVVFCLVVAGRPLPNTFYQKAVAASPIDALGRGLDLLWRAVLASPLTAHHVGWLFVAVGLTALFFRAPRAPAFAFAALPALLAVGVAATRPMPAPEAFYWQRYLVPIGPLFAALFAVGMATAGAVLSDLVRPRRRDEGDDDPSAARADDAPRAAVSPAPGGERAFQVPEPILALALAAVVTVPFLSAPRLLDEAAGRFALNVRDVDRMNVAAGIYLRDEAGLPEGACIATQDAGAVRYFARRPVLDLLGLNDHRLVDLALEGLPVASYLDARAPAAICVLDPDPGATPFVRYARARGLLPARRFSTDAYSLFGPAVPRSLLVFLRRSR